MNPAWLAFAPRLNESNCEETSPPTEDYNCLAFAAGDLDCWWEPYVIPPRTPGIFWPKDVLPDNTVEAWSAALATRGFRPCSGGSVEPALVKVALYAHNDRATHAARQRKDGRWTSKLGESEDILHQTPEDVGGGDYGDIVLFLARPRLPEDP